MDLDFEMVLATGLFILVLTLCLYWYNKKILIPYSRFPSYRFDLKVIYCLLARKYPKDIPFTSFILQETCMKLQLFYSEGLCLLWIFHPFLCIFSEEAVKAFSQEREAIDKPFIYKPVADSTGTGLIVSNGDTWKAHRKMCNPAFRLQMLKSHIPVFNKHAAAMVKTLTNTVEEPSINIEDYMVPCTINIMLESIFGLNEEDIDDIHELHLISEKLSTLIPYRMIHPFLYWKFLLKFSEVGRTFLRENERADNLARKIVMQMKEATIKSQTIENTDEDSHSRNSLIQMLLEIHLKNPTLTIQNVVDEAKTFFFGGYHTVLSALVWIIFMLGLHQDFQEQAYNEMKSLSNKDITYEDLLQLTYLDCFIKETMRLYPAVPLFARRLDKDIKYGKYEVPKGTNIIFLPYVYHRNPNLYPDPERFDPDRFREGNSDNHPWTHIAFSEGIRNCIGKKFALLELKVILVYILTKFKITALDRREDVDLDWALVLKSTRPLRTKLTLRS